ncbi:MAG: hypothetical protein WBA22_10070 [Candidatus Methanofastidiosia archaeon]
MEDEFLLREKFFRGLDKFDMAIKDINQVIYVRGDVGTDYFDVDEITMSPEGRKLLVETYVKLLEDLRAELQKEGNDGFDSLIFLEKERGPVGVLPLAGSIADKLDCSLHYIKNRVSCDCKLCTADLRVKPDLEPGSRVVIVDDTCTTATGAKNAIGVINCLKKNVKVVGVVVLMNRVDEIESKIDPSIKFRAFLHLRDLIGRGYIDLSLEKYKEMFRKRGEYLELFLDAFYVEGDEREKFKKKLRLYLKEKMKEFGLNPNDEDAVTERMDRVAMTYALLNTSLKMVIAKI